MELIFKVRTEFQAMPRCRQLEIAGLLNPFMPSATGLLALGHLSVIHDQLPVGKIKVGMEAGDFQQLAQLMVDVIIHQKSVHQDVTQLRKPFSRMRYCFDHDQMENYLQEIQRLLLP